MPVKITSPFVQPFRRTTRAPQLAARIPGPLTVLTRPRLTQRANLTSQCLCHNLILEALPAVLAPPVIFAGLVVALWTWKCMMMIIFQNKIIYMPFLPPNAREETLADYARRCSPVEWREQSIRSVDGTEIALCIGTIEPSHLKVNAQSKIRKHVLILYFQGNASSLPPRLPYLADILKSLSEAPSHTQQPVEYTLVGVSYRGFWTSKGRPSQSGIELDIAAALKWVTNTYAPGNEDIQLVLWGQSIGAGIACSAAAAYLSTASDNEQISRKVQPRIAGLLLETPFTSIRSMLATIYPQKWLPYRYLWPFLRNWWDSKLALREIAQTTAQVRPRVLILQAGQDELVPREHGLELEAFCKEMEIAVERKEVAGALHTESMTRGEGQSAITQYLRNIADEQ